ncbi:hypothetical protein ECH27V05_03810 [Escherichia coli O145:H28]|nr:hypothetical protein BY03_20830 [Escherichia coli O111:NM str. 2011C-3573]EYY87854.1 hypothetical protein BX71_03160 [Escherichia coli O111:NM str. 2010C-4715]GDK76262.1 hypothetical protein BvCmsKSP013_02906 [Escherichia coli]GEE11798.1 hypothetical protein ECH27V05_03810 [Escherichia coli O145:H28]
MGQRPRSVTFCQVDCHLTRLIVCRRLTLTTGTKSKPKTTVQRKRFCRHVQHVSQVMQRVISPVQISLTTRTFHIITKLHTTKTKRITELLRRNIPLAAFWSGTIAVGGVTLLLTRDFTQRLHLINQLITMCAHIIMCITGRLKTALQFLPVFAITDKNVATGLMPVHVKGYSVISRGCWRFPFSGALFIEICFRLFQ